MTSLIDKKDLSNISKDLNYKVRKIAPINLIKPTNQSIIKKKITTLKSTYINGSKKLVTNTKNSKNISSSRIVNSKPNSKNKSKLNNTFNPPSFINKLSNQTKRISSSTNKNLISKKKNGITFVCFSHKTSNQNSLNKEKNKIDNKLKNNSNNSKQNSKRQKSLSCTKKLFFNSRENSLNNDNKKISVNSRENSVHHLSIFPLFSNNIQLKMNSNSHKNSIRNENSVIVNNSINNNINYINNNHHGNNININHIRNNSNNINNDTHIRNNSSNINNDTHIRNNSNNINNDTHIRNNSNNINNDTHIRNNSNNINNNYMKKETSVSKKVSISILRERQNFIQKKKMYKSFLNQKKQITLNVNLNKKFLEKEKEKNNKLKNQNLTNRIIVHTEIDKEQEKLVNNTFKRNLLNLNNLPKDTNKYLRTYSNSLSKEIFDESSIDNIDNVLNSNEYFEFEHKDYEITEKDINSIIKKINFDEIRVNAKSIFSYKFNKEHEFYTSKFTKNFEQNIINNNSYYTLSTASSNLTKRTKENSSSKSLVYCNMIMKK